MYCYTRKGTNANRCFYWLKLLKSNVFKEKIDSNIGFKKHGHYILDLNKTYNDFLISKFTPD